MFHHEIVDVTKEKLPFKLIIHKNTSATIPKHWHRSFELSFTLRGKINSFIINGKEQSPVNGTILVINPNEVHSISATTKEGENNVALSLLIPYSFMTEVINDFPYRFYHLPLEEEQSIEQKHSYKQMQRAFETLFYCMENPTDNIQLKIFSLVYEILYELSEHFSMVKLAKNDLQQTDSSELEWIDSVIIYIQQYFTSPLSVSELADAFHLTPSYFSRKFKRYMDMSVMDYITEVRLQKAFQQLIHTQKNIQAISDSCGFPNHKSLIQVFKKTYGLTPVQYRKKQVSHK
ncbi:AraC family transcriptional regulator [Enterococcus sp. LJL99]